MSHLHSTNQAQSNAKITFETKCLWSTLVDNIPSYPTLNQNEVVDVCVIGGGFTGLSTALHLAEYGQKVCVLEAHTVGAGGSGRNVGLVNAGTWARPDDLNQYLGEQAGEKLTTALGLAPKLVFSVIDKYGIDAQDTRTGNLHMAHNKTGELDVDIRYQQLSRRGANVEVLTGAKCHEYCGTTKINKALLDKRAGTVNPFAYVTGLGIAATKLGVAIFENSPVTQISRDGDGWLVHSNQYAVKAQKVVIATNAYTEGEWTNVHKSFYFVEYYQIATEPLSGETADRILPYRNGSWDTRLALSSIRRDKDGRLLLGTVGSSTGKPKSFFLNWAKHVQQHYFPDLPKFQWEYEWCGKFGFTPDHIMRIFEPAPGIVAATGFNGRGITTGTLFGKAFADYLYKDDREVLPLPFKQVEDCQLSFCKLRSWSTEAGLTLYHAGQFLKIIP
ncbi:NAD(P)/FAD-dependent oxidoreductase [Gallibacterium genomosp. 3]|uniref:L-pipecolate oxidase n=1 Tax=Gallibacterium genomosp. 3 TaxID=505345 RepID=UPI0008027E58|nr:FAD-binding oxidoreductase [Gallibacterium genomosp. 3]